MREKANFWLLGFAQFVDALLVIKYLTVLIALKLKDVKEHTRRE